MGRKSLLLIMLILILPMGLLFAGGAAEGKLIYLPRNIVNNTGVMIELSQAKELSTVAADYSNTSSDNLALFRLRDTLRKDNSHSQPANNVVLTISSQDNWQFIHEDNPTSKIGFQMNAFCTERKRDGRNFNNYVSTKKLEETTKLGYSNFEPNFKKEGDVYTCLIPFTDFGRDILSYYANYIREYDFCIVIPNDVTAESGYYTTTLTVTSTTVKEYDEDGNSTGTTSLSETITIRGYVGLDPGTGSGDYSFFVSSTADTYSMDLDISSQSTPYWVANVQFLNVDVKSSKPDADTEKTRYTIYISPSPTYSVGGTGADTDLTEYRYKFIKMGTESQARNDTNTIYYDLYLKTSANGYTALKSCTANTTYATGTIGSAGVLSNSVKTTFKLLPKFESEQISKSGLLGGNNEYKVTWTLDQDIYLKLTQASLNAQLQHQPGIYYSNIYFTMVVN